MHRRPLTLLLLSGALFTSSQNAAVFSSAVNRSIDDTLGDAITGQRPTFLPSTIGVWEDQTCISCVLKPPISSAFDGTYTAASYNSSLESISISFNFTGTAIYIFFILANKPSKCNYCSTAASFTLDGSIVGSFIHLSNTSGPAFQFNDSALAFSETGLKNTSHQMLISNLGLSAPIWINFDYALYTFEEAVVTNLSTSSSSPAATSSSSSDTSLRKSHAGAIVGGIIGGLVALGALVVIFFLYRRGRRQQHQVLSGNINYNNEATNESTVQQAVALSVLPATSSQQQQNMGDLRAEIRRMRQREVVRQMRVINEEIEDLRNEASEYADGMRDTNASSASIGLTTRQMSSRQGRSTRRAGSSADENEGMDFGELQDQIRMMTEQIAFLQSQLNSARVQGHSDGPPPDYFPRTASLTTARAQVELLA